MKYIILIIILLTYSCKIAYEDVEYNVCSATNLSGTCPDGKYCNEHGICEIDYRCSAKIPNGTCKDGYICKLGECKDKCSPEKPNGACKNGYTCNEGECIAQDIDLGDFNTFTGTWAQKQTLPSTTRSFGIDNRSITYSYLLNKIVQKDNLEMEVNTKTCDIIVDVQSQFATTTIPKRFIDHLEPVDVTYTYYKENNSIMVKQEESIQLKGVRMDDPKNEAMPENKDDVRVFDQDEDNNPGMTIIVTAIGNASKLYIAQRTKLKLTGKIINKNEFSGSVIWSDEQAVLGAENEALNEPMSIRPDLENSTFKTIRIDDSWTCEDILNNKETLFED